MPFTTLFATVKLGFNRVEEKLSVLARGSRVAVSISTSAGELTRVGTRIVRDRSESRGKTWYNSTSTWLILASGIVLGTISPVITAWLMTVVSVRAKSSAVSVSIFPGLGRRDSAPSRPSGLPVLKKKCSAHAGSASPIPIIRIAVAKLNRDLMIIIFVLIPTGLRPVIPLNAASSPFSQCAYRAIVQGGKLLIQWSLALVSSMNRYEPSGALFDFAPI